jgi:hypothetical protein
MKTRFTTTLGLALALTLLAPLPRAFAEEDLKEKAKEAWQEIKEGTREAVAASEKAIKEGWAAAKEYASKDPKEYRAGAERRLTELGTEITDLQAKAKTSGLAERPYFATRVTALEGHLDFAKKQLADLPTAEGADFDKARASLDKTIGNLESALSQAKEELGDGVV